jgi:hypothetical protein
MVPSSDVHGAFKTTGNSEKTRQNQSDFSHSDIVLFRVLRCLERTEVESPSSKFPVVLISALVSLKGGKEQRRVRLFPYFPLVKLTREDTVSTWLRNSIHKWMWEWPEKGKYSSILQYVRRAANNNTNAGMSIHVASNSLQLQHKW